MKMDERLEKIKDIAKEELSSCPGHNFDHVMRVYNLALNLAKDEDVDLEVIEAAAILHDIGGRKESEDKTGKVDHAIAGAEMAEPILKKLGYSKDKIKHIQDCIISHRFRTDNKPKTMEAKILFDADKLETIGAIGIARSFVWVGKNNAHIYRKVSDLDKYIEENLTGKKANGRIIDKAKHSPQLNWELKDKHIMENLYTRKAKMIARERFLFCEKFYKRLEDEVSGKV